MVGRLNRFMYPRKQDGRPSCNLSSEMNEEPAGTPLQFISNSSLRGRNYPIISLLLSIILWEYLGGAQSQAAEFRDAVISLLIVKDFNYPHRE